jgi:hypothetical protein
MKFIQAVLAFSAIVSFVSATPAPHKRFMKRDVNPDLIPQFGVTPGIPLGNSASCTGITGANGQPIAIPCDCPPNRDQFIADLNANVAAGKCINNTEVAVPPFPEDNSVQSQLTIFHIATITLQNLRGPGQGCPQSSTTWGAQAQKLQAAPPAAPASPAAIDPPATSATPAASACPAASPSS